MVNNFCFSRTPNRVERLAFKNTFCFFSFTFRKSTIRKLSLLLQRTTVMSLIDEHLELTQANVTIQVSKRAIMYCKIYWYYYSIIITRKNKITSPDWLWITNTGIKNYKIKSKFDQLVSCWSFQPQLE